MTLTPEDRAAATWRHLQDHREPVRKARDRKFWRTIAIGIPIGLLGAAAAIAAADLDTLTKQIVFNAGCLLFGVAWSVVLWRGMHSMAREFIDTYEDWIDQREARRRSRRPSSGAGQ